MQNETPEKTASPASPTPAVPVEPVFSGLSKWEGWDQGRLPWSEAKHKDAVCAAVFRSGWSMEDAAALIGFIDRTWGDCTITPPAPAVGDGPEPFGWVSCGIFTKDAETARHWREGGVDYTTVYASTATDLREENERLKAINAALMGDDENQPRYTTKRLRQELERATVQLRIDKEAAEALLEKAREENERLRNVAQRRDEFIISKGLWEEFKEVGHG